MNKEEREAIIENRKARKEKQEREKKARLEELEQRIKVEYEAATDEKEIARTKYMTIQALNKFVKRLKGEGKIDETKREQAIQRIQKEKIEEQERKRQEQDQRIKEDYELAVSLTKISEKEHMPTGALKTIVERLKGEGKIDEGKRQQVIQERQKIKEEKIEEQAKIREEKDRIRQEEQKKLEQRNKRIKENYEAGIKKKEIAEAEHISKVRINQIIKEQEEIEESKRKEAIENNKENQYEAEKSNGQYEQNKLIGKDYITECRKNSKANNENNEKQDTAKLREAVEEDYDKVTMNDIIFVINVHLQQHEYKNVIKFINGLILFDNIKQLDKSRLEKIKKQIEYNLQLNKVRQLLRNEVPIQLIAYQSNLQEDEIIKIANQLRNEESKNKALQQDYYTMDSK